MIDRLLDAVRGVYPDMPELVRGALAAQFGKVAQQQADEWHEAIAEANADRRTLLRRLDVALNGEAGAAKQASLCDLVAQVERQQRAVSIINFDDGMVINFRAPDGRRATIRLVNLFDAYGDVPVIAAAGVIDTMRAAVAAYPSAGPRVPVELDPHEGEP